MHALVPSLHTTPVERYSSWHAKNSLCRRYFIKSINIQMVFKIHSWLEFYYRSWSTLWMVICEQNWCKCWKGLRINSPREVSCIHGLCEEKLIFLVVAVNRFYKIWNCKGFLPNMLITHLSWSSPRWRWPTYLSKGYYRHWNLGLWYDMETKQQSS